VDVANGRPGARMTAREAPTDRARPASPVILAEAALIGLVILVLGITGPFGTYGLGPWSDRLAYWLRTLAAGYVLYRPALWLAERLARRHGIGLPAAWAIAIGAVTLPMTLWLWYFGPEIDPSRRLPRGGEFLETYLQILVIAVLAIGGLGLVRARLTEAPAPARQGDDAGIGEMLAARLPRHLGRDVQALRMEDHYVRVYTPQGEALLLMRMSDAVRDVRCIDGAQVHRSWWIARAAIDRIEGGGRQLRLRLVNGLEVPVARRRLAELKAQRWL
jgi:LytTr DNA-binding domain